MPIQRSRTIMFIILLTFLFNWSESVWLDDNGGYRSIVIAVDPRNEINCNELRKNIEVVGHAFSKSLYKATSEKLHVAAIDVILPISLAKACNATAAGTRMSWPAADIQITSGWNVFQRWNPKSSRGVGVQQSWGCGHPGDRILLDYSTLNQSQDLKDERTEVLGRSLVAAWARYRWGIYEESTLNRAENGNKSCLEDWNCASETLSHFSIMKNVLYDNATFCEASTHDGLSRNQHNLACKGLSAMDVMKRHPDFREKYHTLAQKYLSTSEIDDYSQEQEGIALNSPSEPNKRERRSEESHVEEQSKVSPKFSSFIGTLPPVIIGRHINNNTQRVDIENKDVKIRLQSEQLKPNLVKSINLMNTTLSPVSWITSSSISKTEVTWVKKGNETNNASELSASSDLPVPVVRFVVPSQKAIVIALDLSSSAVTQASVEWLRGGLLRWMFGLGEGVHLGILAAYSNMSFPLSPGPLSPGPIIAQQLEEYMALLPYQHEVNDDVYGGKYCLACIIEETKKMFDNAQIPLESGVLVLTVCEPQLSSVQMRLISESVISIHTVTICPNAPLYIENMATNDGNSWALSTPSMALGITAEIQLGHLLTEITKETVLSPSDLRLKTLHEKDQLLRKDQVERIGSSYRRVKGTIKVKSSARMRLFVITTSIPAKVVVLRDGKRKFPLQRDTTRRYWAMLESDAEIFEYSLKFLSTSLEFPLSIATGVYEKSEESGVQVMLRTNTRRYRPGNARDPYLSVITEVTLNGNPIQNADVVLSVTYLNGQSPSTYSLMLLDNGSTEPDIRKGDGVYSRYLTWTPGTGRYILTASVSNTKASITESFKDNKIEATSTGPFSATSSSLSLVVEMVPPGDIFPPSRITDLNAVLLRNSLVNITWSAPGGDLDQGSAWRYHLKMYTESAALSRSRFDSSGIDVYCIQGDERAPTPAPALFGTLQHCVASIPFANLDWYFAMKATDGANNSGEISNIVSVFVYDESTTSKSSRASSVSSGDSQTVIMSTVDHSPMASEEDDSWRIYGIALVAAIGFVMLSVAVFAFVLCCRRRRAKAVMDSDRPIYKIYVNNAYIQEDDGKIKVIDKEKSLHDKVHTQHWVNSLDKYPIADDKEKQADISCDTTDSSHQSPGKCPKPVRFGVLTNGSIMRELPSSSSSSSSRPSEEALPDDFKYKDLSSETTSNSTLEGGGGPSMGENLKVVCHSSNDLRIVPSSYQPLGIPPLRPGSDDDEGGFRPELYSSFRHSSSATKAVVTPHHFHSVSKATNAVLPHGTVRSVKKRRHISFV